MAAGKPHVQLRVIEGGAVSSGRRPFPDEPEVRVIQPRRPRLFGMCELELVASPTGIANELVVSLPFAAFSNAGIRPQVRLDGTFRASIQIGELQAVSRHITFSQNWLRFQVGHPGGESMSHYLRDGETVLVYWIGEDGGEYAVTFQIQGDG